MSVRITKNSARSQLGIIIANEFEIGCGEIIRKKAAPLYEGRTEGPLKRSKFLTYTATKFLGVILQVVRPGWGVREFFFCWENDEDAYI